MTKLAPYIKPYLWAILAAVAFLFVQANADLALPDYMSRIVNVGIQQGGVESAAAEAFSADTFERITMLVDDDARAMLERAYTRVDPGSTRAADLAGTYPALESQPVYVRGELTEEETTTLTAILAPAVVAAGALDQMGGPAALQSMSPEMVARLMEQGRARFDAIGPEALAQAAAAQVRVEYEALGMDMAVLQRSYILRTGGVMLGLTLLAALAAVVVGFISARVAAGLARDVRHAIFERVENFSSAEFDRFSTASLITRSTNDVMQIQRVTVMLIRMVFYAPIIGVGGVIRAVGKSAELWWIILLAVGILSVLIVVVYFLAVPKFKILQKLVDRLNLVARESLSGMMVIRAFSMQKHEEKRFDDANIDLTRTSLFVNRVMVIMMPLMMFIMNGLMLLIIWVGADQVAASTMQVGDLMAFMQYTMQIVFAFLMLSMMFIMLPRAAVSAERISEVLRTKPNVLDPETTTTPPEPHDLAVEFRNVSFRYPEAEEDALHSISFTANPGKLTGIIGATGSGKSTIVNLIPRFHDTTEGQILVGGVDVRSISQHDLRELLGYVPQRATLFSGTIASNLRYAREDAPDEELLAAAEIAQADELLQTDEGLEREIAQAGANLSGGQKQRVSIARALVKDPPVYIFDDSFSALDYSTDAKLRRALRERSRGSTVIVVSQRVATIRNADRILVLDKGAIVGSGTHDELMADNDTYREIVLSQMTEEEA
jgi:ATP-binding cassette subfamily B protein